MKEEITFFSDAFRKIILEIRLANLLHTSKTQVTLEEYLEQVELSWYLDGLDYEDGLELTIFSLQSDYSA
jgi:hypothetical protein